MPSSSREETPIGGSVARGFEPVAECFRENFDSRGECGGACAVYHRDELVVDLWGGYRDLARTEPWSADTLVLVFSTTKGMAATAMAVARDRGLLAYDDRVAEHWPAFGQHGKDDVTIAQLLGHQAGVAAIEETLTPETIADRAGLMELLARKEPDWDPGARHGYHAWSLGWYESELLRRVDPEGRTMGAFFSEEVADPLDLDVHIGLPESVPGDRVAEIAAPGPRRLLSAVRHVPLGLVASLVNPRSVASKALNPFDIGSPAELNDPAYRALEIPAGTGIGQVRDLATVYGDLATGGDALGLGADTIERLAAPPTPPREGRRDVVLQTDTSYSLGFWKPFDGFAFGSPRAFGAQGAGGSFAFADPEADLGFAYAPNRMGVHLWNDPREVALREAVYDCLDGR